MSLVIPLLETLFNSFNCFRFCIHISADSWPQVFDDSDARRDWKWKPKYDLDKLVDLMVQDVKDNYLKKENNGS